MNENSEQRRIPTETYRAEPGGGPANPKTIQFVALFVLGLIIMIVVLTGRREVARWYDASARNAFADKQYEEAIEAANTALQWEPDNPQLIELRVMARMKNEDFEGCLADCDELLAEAAKDEVENEADYAPLPFKAAALQRLGRHEETLEVWAKIVAYRKREFELRDDYESRYAYAMSLNNRAYMVAQAYVEAEDEQETAKFDVGEALEEIELALEVRNVPDDAVMLDTHGYLLLLNGKPEEALEILKKAVELTKAENDASRSKLKSIIRVVDEPAPYEAALKELDQQFAIILHHRGEAFEVMGQPEKAAEDIAEAVRLGYNPDEGIW